MVVVICVEGAEERGQLGGLCVMNEARPTLWRAVCVGVLDDDRLRLVSSSACYCAILSALLLFSLSLLSFSFFSLSLAPAEFRRNH